jgi:hypothetical protein
MIKIFILISATLLFTQCGIHKTKETTLKVHVNIVGILKPDSIKGQAGKIFYNIHIDMLNNTNSIVRFWSMSCAWQDNWIFNSNLFRLYLRGCDSNVPEIREITPGQKITFNGIILVLDTINTNEINKLGFILMREKEVKDPSDFNKILFDKIDRHKDVIWSNSFKLNK